MAWDDYAPRAIASLSRDLQISPQQAAGVVGQLGFESEGLQAINERQPVVPGSRGGYGWAQWTGPRRKQFESWAADQGLDISTPEANYGFLVHELTNTPESRVLDAIRQAEDAQSAGRVFTDKFLRPGIPNHEGRQSWTEKAMNFLIPPAQAATLSQEQTSMKDRIQAARDAGFTDDEIMARIQSNEDMAARIQRAKDAGFSDDEIFGRMGLSAGQPQEAHPIQAPDNAASGGGVMAGIGMGLRDPIDAGAQMLRRAVPEGVGQAVDQFGNMLADAGLPVARSEGVRGVDNIINQVNTDYEAARAAAGREGMDWARLGGNVAGLAPAAYATPQALAAGIGRLGAGAVQGAAFGALQPVVGEKAQDQFGQSKSGQAAIGGALGAALPAAGSLL